MEVINYLLGYEKLKVYQNSDMFNFSLDSILLPRFVSINKSAKNILDIGSGNAVIPIILTTRTVANIDAVEIQKEVYELGKKSISYNKLDNQINLYNMDINDFYKEKQTDYYDIITCNPPFFKVDKESNLNKNDYKTIARHEIKLNLDDIFKISKKLLKNNGIVAIVHRTDRLIDILQSMKKYNIEPKKIQFVYPKKNMESNIVLIEGRKNGGSGLKILSPIIVHNQNGDYSKQVLKYFN